METDIPDFNDRCTLILLQNKENRSGADKRMINKLKYRYSNYAVYEDILVKKLIQMGFLEKFETHPSAIEPETGYEIQNNENVIYYVTSKPGEKSLTNNYFPSDYWEKLFKTKVARALLIAGAIGGLMSIIKEALGLFKH